MEKIKIKRQTFQYVQANLKVRFGKCRSLLSLYFEAVLTEISRSPCSKNMAGAGKEKRG